MKPGNLSHLVTKASLDCVTLSGSTCISLYCITPDDVWHFVHHTLLDYSCIISHNRVFLGKDCILDDMIDGMPNCIMDGSAQQSGMAQWHSMVQLGLSRWWQIIIILLSLIIHFSRQTPPKFPCHLLSSSP